MPIPELDDFGGAGYAIPFYNATLVGSKAFGGLFGGGGGSGPTLNVEAELARIAALYEGARKAGEESITRDFQAQRGELANSQAARGILRSPVSGLGLQRLGAARSRALAEFNANILGSQAGTQSSVLNALLGRRTTLDLAERDRRDRRQAALLGAGTALVGGALAGPAGAAAAPTLSSALRGGGYNYANSNYLDPRSFYLSEFS